MESYFSYGINRQLTEHSSISMGIKYAYFVLQLLTDGTVLAQWKEYAFVCSTSECSRFVQRRDKVVHHAQRYIVPILLSEEFSWEVLFYGTVIPV